MQTTQHGWQIIDGDAGVLAFSYKYGTQGRANSFTAKLPSGGLMVISPPTRVTAAEMGDLAAFGDVEAIVANNGFHYLGIASWRQQFPRARCFAAPGARARILKKSKDIGELELLSALQPLLGDRVAVVEAPASKGGETWAWAQIAGGYAWYASDVLANMDALPSSFVARTLFKWTNSAPGYKIFGLATKFLLSNRKLAFGQMLEDVRKHPPTVMVPAHGAILASGTVGTETEQLLVAAT